MDTVDISIMIALLAAVALFLRQGGAAPEKELKCVISHEDGNTYCVRERAKLQLAADLLARVTKKLAELVTYVGEHHPEDPMAARLTDKFDPQRVYETLPTSKHVAYTENKGEKMAFCVTRKKKGNDLIDENTLTFVAIHELAHIATDSVGHEPEFWENFKTLLGYAKEAGVYHPEKYSEQPREYCGMTITDNPYFDYKG
jgi:hypothetical protein